MADHERHFATAFKKDHCVICKLNFENEEPVHVTKKGMLTIIECCEKHGKDDLYTYLNECISTNPIETVLVHSDCRRNFTDKKRPGLQSPVVADEIPSAKRLRSSTAPFNWKDDCLLCAKHAFVDTRHPQRECVHRVSTIPMRRNLLECCKERGDLWASEIENRLQGCIDLVAAEARYHDSCLTKFMLKRDPKTKITATGRPQDEGMLKWFKVLIKWLESESGAELYTLTELHSKMVEFSDGDDVYTIKRLKQKLQEHYKEHIFFANVEGRENVVCFKNMAKYIINEKWQSSRDSMEDKAEWIVSTAAKIIRDGIREKIYDCKSYPANEDIASISQSSQWVPHHLQTFLKLIVISEVKQNSIGHAIVQASRPRSVIAPIMFGVGIEMDHVFGSKWLINELSHLGFSISYDEVVKYKQSVIQSETLENLLSEYIPGTFTQWVADNVDHNIVSLDGQGSFHGMGIIAVSSPKDAVPLQTRARVIPRLPRITANEVVKDKGLTIMPYMGHAKRALSSIIYDPILHLQVPYTLQPDVSSDLIWHAGWLACGAGAPRPSWSGFMQHVFSYEGHAKSEVLFLPIVDLNPSNETCIYSTLLYIENQALQLGIPVPCVTFDQPLWIKAIEIIKTKSLKIVCRLGGFHTMMSFVGSIGSVMKGSGLEEALETAYGPNAVTQMMSGKAISRALRGHFLVEGALVNKLMSALLPCELESNLVCFESEGDSGPDNVDKENSNGALKLNSNEVCKICEFYQGFQEGSMSISEIAESAEVLKLEECLVKHKALLAEQSPTAKLWLQYIEYIETLKLFIRAERSGNWSLHLVAVTRMLNLFAATGHINYAKSARLYLQLMLELPKNFPWLHEMFINQGFHAVRRSSRYWAGLWTDLVIEQVMMRSIKSRGGLTRGRGITESVRLQWILSMHKCAGIHEAMTTMTDMKTKASEQHIELGRSRCERDFQDLLKIQEWFDEHEPFDVKEVKLRSLSSGLTTTEGDGINPDKVEEVGLKIQMQLDGLHVAEASIKRRDHIKPLADLKPGIQVDQQKLNINPVILFSRLIAIVQREEDMSPYFDYELTAFPTSLFKDNLMRKSVKAQLAKSLTDSVDSSEHRRQVMHVLDGGALLHRVKWGKKLSYQEVAKQYVSYVRGKYGESCVVFDGYEQGPSIKDHEHLRRVKNVCADIQLRESMEAYKNQEVFLANEKNKHQFILLISQYLRDDGQVVHQSTGDADTMIVQCALQYAIEGSEVNVVADDTDVLVLLLYHWKQNMASIYFLSEAGKYLKIWRISDLIGQAGPIVTLYLLFLHAWSGCDTTSATFGQGKISLMKKLKQSKDVQAIAELMMDHNATVEQVGEVGVRLFVIVFGGKQSDSLNTLRYAKYMEMVASAKNIDPQKLPPTARAAYYHSLRVHLQVILWKELTTDSLDPLIWGWKLDNSKLQPIMTDLEPAPESLLKFVRCKCKLSTANPCGNNTCSCRKHGLKCVTACGDCRGESCRNAEEIVYNNCDDIISEFM